MILLSMLFLNQAVFIWMAIDKGISLWIIFLISFIYSNIVNIIFYYGTEQYEKALQKIRGKKKKSRWYRTCYVVLRRLGKWTKIITMIIYFFMPAVPIFFIKEICIIIAEIEGIKFRILVILSIFQIATIYAVKIIFLS